jgi:hypothetical protein
MTNIKIRKANATLKSLNLTWAIIQGISQKTNLINLRLI